MSLEFKHAGSEENLNEIFLVAFDVTIIWRIEKKLFFRVG